jgi:hypothetical protein
MNDQDLGFFLPEQNHLNFLFNVAIKFKTRYNGFNIRAFHNNLSQQDRFDSQAGMGIPNG